MIRRLRACPVLNAARARGADGGRSRVELGRPVSTGERLTVQECAQEANRRRAGNAYLCAPVSPVSQLD